MANYIPRALFGPNPNPGGYSSSRSYNLTFTNYAGSSGPGGLWNGYAYRSNLSQQNNAPRVTMDQIYYTSNYGYNSYNNTPSWLQRAYEGTAFFSMITNLLGNNKC